MKKVSFVPELNNIFSSVIDGIIIIDENGIMQAVNPAVENIFGYSEAELIAQNVKILMPKPHRQQHDGYINNYLNTGVRKIIGIGREVDGIKKDGTLFPFRLSISESYVDGIKYFTGIIHDISELKAVQLKLEASNKELEERVIKRTEELTNTVNKLLVAKKSLEQEVQLRKSAEIQLENALEKERQLGGLKSQFVTLASHEFRTPLSTILSSASLISRYISEDQQGNREKHISKIKSAVKNMAGILDDFLSIGKIEEGKISIKSEEFDLTELINSISEQLQTILKKGQHIQITGPGQLNIVCDVKLIENIIINLLSNAIKYSGESSRIDVVYGEKNGHIHISVSDKGIGIPKEEQKFLFDRFFRASNASNIQGTGLGLHIVKKYLEYLGGQIDIDSDAGLGLTVYISIPKAVYD